VNAVAVIPARGGSKGVPRKNLRTVAGLPLIAHMLGQARVATRLAAVFVSTDDQEIAAVARSCGAEVIERPAEISGDTASSEAALLHALDLIQTRRLGDPDVIVMLQCTSPLTRAADIDGTIAALEAEQADSSLSVTPFPYFLWRRGELGAEAVNHDMRIRRRRQDAEAQFVETGAVYAMRVQGFQQARHRFFGKVAMYVMPGERCLEIDEEIDLQLADERMRALHLHPAAASLPSPVRALVCDFDGVFTDNTVIVLQDGREAVRCSRGDGYGLSLLKQRGFPILVLSKERNPVVEARCRKLQIECLSGIDDKLPALKSWLQGRAIALSETVYVGNDVNDLECLKAVGCGAVVADAHHAARSAARLVLSQRGGEGAVRELTDLILISLERQSVEVR
jgi:YrbI family 3-deoxy-D-manno-octulosonate 8-phosphate phosphatase